MIRERSVRSRLLEELWPPGTPGSVGVYAILDAARDQRIYGEVFSAHAEKCCLYSGDLPWQVEMAAPYLVQLEREDRFTDFVLQTGWGNAWGIFFSSETSLKNLRRHLRSFLKVTDDSGRRLLFRYYDPRVLRIYLPTCWPAELRAVFGPIDRFLMEAEDPGVLLQYQLRGNKLVERRVRLDQQENGVRSTSATP
jgi:hypothetical protein